MVFLVKPRDPAWVEKTLQPGPSGGRFDDYATAPSFLRQAADRIRYGSSSELIMFDSVNAFALPSGLKYAAGYFNGSYANIGEIRGRFPSAVIASVTPDSAKGAMYTDIEPGDGVPADVPGFINAGGLGFYCSASELADCEAECVAAGIPRARYKAWTAHWIGPHICGPGTCGYAQADATQWVSTPGWDESWVADLSFFFGSKPAPPPKPGPPPKPVPLPAWQRELYSYLPNLVQGNADPAGGFWVRQAQLLCNIAGTVPCSVDGDFGPETRKSVLSVQRAHSLAHTGSVGRETWEVLAAQRPGEVLPDVSSSSQDYELVRRIQACCRAHDLLIDVDGSFGPATDGAVRTVQEHYLGPAKVDGIVGPATWCCLLAHRAP